MAKKKRKPEELTTEEAIRKLFPKKVVDEAKERAREASKKPVKSTTS